VLHHFGSRERLVQEVCKRHYDAIRADLVTAMASVDVDGAGQVTAMLDSVARAVRAGGHARVVFWLALEGLLAHDDGEPPRLALIGQAAQALRTRGRKRGAAPVEDTLHTLALSTLVLLAEAVIGPAILRDLGLGATPRSSERFRAWLARLVTDHLEHGPK
jgi:AcrR family transcriptional regulator